MADWEIGDLALCVSHGDCPDCWMAGEGGPALGSIHAVTEVTFGEEEFDNPEGIYLGFSQWNAWFFHEAFCKVTPGTEIEGREVERKVPTSVEC